jgi:hypothetical protein
MESVAVTHGTNRTESRAHDAEVDVVMIYLTAASVTSMNQSDCVVRSTVFFDLLIGFGFGHASASAITFREIPLIFLTKEANG